MGIRNTGIFQQIFLWYEGKNTVSSTKSTCPGFLQEDMYLFSRAKIQRMPVIHRYLKLIFPFYKKIFTRLQIRKPGGKIENF